MFGVVPADPDIVQNAIVEGTQLTPASVSFEPDLNRVDQPNEQAGLRGRPAGSERRIEDARAANSMSIIRHL